MGKEGVGMGMERKKTRQNEGGMEGWTWVRSRQAPTLLASFKARLQTSYLGLSLGVFWQIVCE